MTTYIFILRGWTESHATCRGGPNPRGPTCRQVQATAATEKEARMAINPHVALWRDALKRAEHGDADWFKRMAATHAEAARIFNRAAVLVRQI